MRIRVMAAMVLAAAVSSGYAAAQDQDFSKVEIESQAVAPGIHMLTGAGGNIGLSVGEDATFIIDDQFAPLTDRIAAAIKAITDKPVRFVVNTHWHGDHTGGNENFGRAGAVIIAHDNVRKRMSADQFNEVFKSTTPAAPKAALPVVTFAESVNLHLNGDTVHVVHVAPAHTDGDSLVHFTKADVLHMGDLFMNGFYPFVDVGSGGDVDGVVAAADQALALANGRTKIIPGHGPLATKADLQAFRDMVATIRDRVTTLIEEGKSLSDVQAARPSKEFDAEWGDGFMKPDEFVGLVYQSLSKGRAISSR